MGTGLQAYTTGITTHKVDACFTPGMPVLRVSEAAGIQHHHRSGQLHQLQLLLSGLRKDHHWQEREPTSLQSPIAVREVQIVQPHTGSEAQNCKGASAGSVRSHGAAVPSRASVGP